MGGEIDRPLYSLGGWWWIDRWVVFRQIFGWIVGYKDLWFIGWMVGE